MTLAYVLERELLDEAIRTSVAVGTGRPCFLVAVPEGESAEMPYSILYPIMGGSTFGSMSHPDSKATIIYQVTSVGASSVQGESKQVSWLSDRVRKTFLGRDPAGAYLHAINAPAGWVVAYRSPDSGIGAPEPGGNGIYYVPERFSLLVVPE